MRRTIWHLPFAALTMGVIATCVFPLFAQAVCAQGTEAQLTLGLRRDFGYGGFGEIQGNFRLTAAGPEDLQRVVFFLDAQLLGEVAQPPWQLRFHTDSFPPGNHSMLAVGYTAAGQELRSNEIRTRFLSAEEARGTTTRLVVTLLGGILGLMVLAFLVTAWLTRRRPHQTTSFGTPRNYGIAGGATCPRCGRPFACHLWAPNMLFGKLERCPYCGKWAIVRTASRAELSAAEARELRGSAHAESVSAPSRQDLEESRFQD